MKYKEHFYTADLENIVEEMVFEELYKIIEEGKLDFCKCNICIQDIAAIVLNEVPGKYKSNFADKSFPSELDKQEEFFLKRKIKHNIIWAIEKVNQNPHH
ncbi:MAG: late competence development ComFB family protein [Fusobacteriota bacterium]